MEPFSWNSGIVSVELANSPENRTTTQTADSLYLICLNIFCVQPLLYCLKYCRVFNQRHRKKKIVL